MRDYMFNNAAIAMPTPIHDRQNIPSQTVSKAMKFGRVWHIPLMNRMGRFPAASEEKAGDFYPHSEYLEKIYGKQSM